MSNIVKSGGPCSSNSVPLHKIPTVAELLKALKYPYIDEPNTESNITNYLQSPINSTLPPINIIIILTHIFRGIFPTSDDSTTFS